MLELDPNTYSRTISIAADYFEDGDYTNLFCTLAVENNEVRVLHWYSCREEFMREFCRLKNRYARSHLLQFTRYIPNRRALNKLTDGLKLKPIELVYEKLAKRAHMCQIEIPKMFRYNSIGMYLFLYMTREALSDDNTTILDNKMAILMDSYIKNHKAWFKKSENLNTNQRRELCNSNLGPMRILRTDTTYEYYLRLVERMSRDLPDDFFINKRIITYDNGDFDIPGVQKSTYPPKRVTELGGELMITTNNKSIKDLIAKYKDQGKMLRMSEFSIPHFA